MKVKVLKATSPYNAEIVGGKLISKNDGKTYISFKDSDGKHQKIVQNDVTPLTVETISKIPGMNKKTQLYVMAGDNFVNLNKENFKIAGSVTNEMITEISEWGALEALVRSSKDKPLIESMGGIILLIILALGGMWLVSQFTGIQLPFMGG